MPRIHVCSLARLHETVAEQRASHVVTLIKNLDLVRTPPGIVAERHLRLDFADIIEPREGEVAPAAHHVEDILAFTKGWDRRQPMVVHCFAGISRSTAGAFIAACHLMPERDEAEIARRIRLLSPTAQPNARLIAFADTLMSRNGRMINAIKSIGDGEPCVEGIPFHLDLV